jgi:hypothetical protein
MREESDLEQIVFYDVSLSRETNARIFWGKSSLSIKREKQFSH